MSASMTNKPEIGWCRKHDGMHERQGDCKGYRFDSELVACDTHGDKPHLRNKACANTRKADPFHGF